MSGADDALAVLEAAIAAADPAQHVLQAVIAAPELRDAPRLHLLAVGKAATRMTEAALAALRSPPLSMLVVIPDGTAAPSNTDVMRGGHPLPDERSFAAGRAIEQQLENAARGDVVLVLLSGGSSALAVLPIDMTVAEYASRVQQMLRGGADIQEVNAMRRRIDRLKGGGMARLAHHTTVVGFVVSDVVGDSLDVIGSGPLTGRDSHARVEIIASNRNAVDGAAAHARLLGYNVCIMPEPLTGEARDAGVRFARAAALLAPRTCLLAGGETTVTVTGGGVGGRNQEFVLAACIDLNGRNITVGSVGTDGVDGPTDAAGAIADAATLQTARKLGLDPSACLARNDSHTFFDSVGGLIRTGPSGTNVMDVQVALLPDT